MDVTTLFKHVGADAKGKYSAPTVDSNEWNQWLSWANEELQSFGEVMDWTEFRKLDNWKTVNASQSSIALESNFKKIAGPVNLAGTFYNEVDTDMFDRFVSTDKKFKVGYNGGWFLEWKGPTTSATTILIPIVFYPTSLATAADGIIMRNPMYLVKRLKVRVFKYRQDPVFAELETEANLMLQQMIENEYYKHSQYDGPGATREEEYGFQLGED